MLILAVNCGENKQKAEPGTEESAVETVDREIIRERQAALDSLEKIRITDSIKQDSLRQVKEHGHVH